jgi:hypothetical protein
MAVKPGADKNTRKGFQQWGCEREERVGILTEKVNRRQERKDGVNNRKEQFGVITERKG